MNDLRFDTAGKGNNRRAGTMVLAGFLAYTAIFCAPQARAQDYPQGYSDPEAATVDPPTRVARVSVVVGNVSLEPASVEQFNQAETNYPMTTGDRIYADTGSNAEIQTGQLAVRLGQRTDLTVTAMTDTLAQFGLTEGSIHLRSYNVYQGETVEVDTPNVAVTVFQSGDVRVDVDPNSGVTVVTVLSGQVQVNGNGVQQVLEPGERLSLQGSNPVYAQLLGGARQDGLDRFSAERDGLYLNAFATEGQYINPGTIGGEDLAAYGSWDSDPDYGAVWYPNGVAYDWQPYRNGHWTWVAPWGWTWVEAEPWGFAPFHYGRWARFGPRWGWIPGPTVVRPIYSPALVAFVGGANFAIGGVGVSAWFPLGPGEPYQPWYHASPRYVNRVNVSNIYSRDVVNVRNVYNQRTVVNTYVNVQNRGFANRESATVVVPHDAFAGGKPVNQAALHVDARAVAGAQILPHPLVTPERSMVVTAPARAVPPVQERPVVASHVDQRVGPGAAMTQGGTSSGGFTRPTTTVQPQSNQPAPVSRQAPPAPQQAPQQPPQKGGFREQPVLTQAPVQPQSFPQRPSAPQQPVQQAPVQPRQQPVVQPQQAAPQQVQQPQRQLFNNAVPPAPRPSFDQQRQAIQQNDPGRPLSPQQLNNLRQNQPAGKPEQQEAPHPVAAPPIPRGGPQKPIGPPKN